MIILDIETTGLSATTNSLVSLGAVDLSTGDEFYGECQIHPGTTVDSFALGVNGFSTEQVTDPTKQSALDLYRSFVKWAEGREPLIGGQQVGSFDLVFLRHLNDLAGTKWPFGHRSVDLHSSAYTLLGKSLSLDGILQAIGLDPEVKPHNALTGAKLEAAAFRALFDYARGCVCRAPGWKS